MPRRGGKRKKARTHVDADKVQQAAAGSEKIPRTFVIKRGKVEPVVGSVVQSLRQMMLPYTAQKLKARKTNKLKDFVSVAGPMGVTHLMMLTQSREKDPDQQQPQKKAHSPSPGGQAVPTSAASSSSSSSSASSGTGAAASSEAPEDLDDTMGAGVQLRIARLPRGPTLTFRLQRFSLPAEVLAQQKRPAVPPSAFETPPLVVLNGFQGVPADSKRASGEDDGDEDEDEQASSAPGTPKHLALASTVLKSMFPAINIATVRLGDCRRVCLFHRDPVSGCIELRQFVVGLRPAGISRGVRKAVATRKLNLGAAQDIAELVERGSTRGLAARSSSSSSSSLSASGTVEDGYVSAGTASDSEWEEDESHGRVVLPEGRGSTGNKGLGLGQSAVRLTEAGPRLSLQLLKIESGLCEGTVLWHAHVSLSDGQAKRQRRDHAERQALRKARRDEQARNVEKKEQRKKEREEQRAAKKRRREQAAEAAAEAAGGDGDGTEADDEDEDEDDGSSSEGSDVGEDEDSNEGAGSGDGGGGDTDSGDEKEEGDEAVVGTKRKRGQ